MLERIPSPPIINCNSGISLRLVGLSARLNLARFTTLQAHYSIASRDLERELVPLLEAEKMGLLVWRPIAEAHDCSID